MKRWRTKPLGEVCELVNGRPFKPHEWEEAGLPIIRIQNLTDRTKPFNYTTQALPEKFKVKRGDTLLSWSGTPGTSFGCFRWDGPEGWLNQHIFNVHLDDEVLSPFFIYQVNSKLDELIAKAHGGVGLQHITKGALSSVNVTVPPLAEQERIVKLLDEADELRKLRAQANHRTAEFIPALFHEMFGDPKRSWRSSALGELVQDFRYGTSNKSTGAGKPTLRIPNVVEQAVNLDDLKFVPVSDSEFDRLQLKDGDLLFVRTNGNPDYVGRCAVFDAHAVQAAGHNAEEFIYASYLIRARLQPERMAPLFAQHFLASPEGCRALRARSKTSAGQFNINTEGLSTIPIPVPPLPLQREFAARVDEIRAMEAQQATSRRRLDDLFQSLLHRAFSGEL